LSNSKLFVESDQFLGDRLQNGSPYAIRPMSVCPVCLWCWCTVAKRLDKSRWNLACR